MKLKNSPGVGGGAGGRMEEARPPRVRSVLIGRMRQPRRGLRADQCSGLSGSSGGAVRGLKCLQRQALMLRRSCERLGGDEEGAEVSVLVCEVSMLCCWVGDCEWSTGESGSSP